MREWYWRWIARIVASWNPAAPAGGGGGAIG